MDRGRRYIRSYHTKKNKNEGITNQRLIYIGKQYLVYRTARFLEKVYGKYIVRLDKGRKMEIRAQNDSYDEWK